MAAPYAVAFRQTASRLYCSQANLNSNRLFLVDTLALVRRLEAEGIPATQAEAMTGLMMDVLSSSLENVSRLYVSKDEKRNNDMTYGSRVSRFQPKVVSSQEYQFSLLDHEINKLKRDVEKMQSESRYEMDKVKACQRLDLNLERAKTRDELNNQNQETISLTNKLDREIHSLRAQLEGGKYEVIKYCIGTLVSISAVGLAVIRILM